MVLNLLRVEEVNPEIMLERSFYQYQNYAAIPEMVKSEYRNAGERLLLEKDLAIHFAGRSVVLNFVVIIVKYVCQSKRLVKCALHLSCEKDISYDLPLPNGRKVTHLFCGKKKKAKQIM